MALDLHGRLVWVEDALSMDTNKRCFIERD